MKINGFNRALMRRGGLARTFWAFNGEGGEGGTGSGGDKFDTNAAIEKLRTDGFVVMKQPAFDNIIHEKYSAAYAKAKSDYTDNTAEVEQLKAENAQLKSKAGDKGETISKADHERLLSEANQRATNLEGKISKLEGVQKRNAIIEAAGKSGAVQNAYGDIADLLINRVALEEKDGNTEFFILDDKGEKRVGKDGFMTIQGYVEEALNQKPYLKAASSNAGAGSTTSTNQGGGNTGKYSLDELADMPMDQFAKVGGMNGNLSSNE